MPARASCSRLGEIRLAERRALGRPLDLDDAAGAGHDEIGVGCRARILRVVEIEHRIAFDDPAGDRGDVVGEHAFADDAAGAHP